MTNTKVKYRTHTPFDTKEFEALNAMITGQILPMTTTCVRRLGQLVGSFKRPFEPDEQPAETAEEFTRLYVLAQQLAAITKVLTLNNDWVRNETINLQAQLREIEEELHPAGEKDVVTYDRRYKPGHSDTVPDDTEFFYATK